MAIWICITLVSIGLVEFKVYRKFDLKLDLARPKNEFLSIQLQEKE